jgi:hypothetical protein
MNARRLALSELARLVCNAYPDPAEYDSLEERRRALHLDLADFCLEDLDRERILARLRWALDPDSSPWLEARLQHLDRTAAALRRPMR